MHHNSRLEVFTGEQLHSDPFPSRPSLIHHSIRCRLRYELLARPAPIQTRPFGLSRDVECNYYNVTSISFASYAVTSNANRYDPSALRCRGSLISARSRAFFFCHSRQAGKCAWGRGFFFPEGLSLLTLDVGIMGHSGYLVLEYLCCHLSCERPKFEAYMNNLPQRPCLPLSKPGSHLRQPRCSRATVAH